MIHIWPIAWRVGPWPFEIRRVLWRLKSLRVRWGTSLPWENESLAKTSRDFWWLVQSRMDLSPKIGLHSKPTADDRPTKTLLCEEVKEPWAKIPYAPLSKVTQSRWWCWKIRNILGTRSQYLIPFLKFAHLKFRV